MEYAGWIGGIMGSLIGVAGGAIGTWSSLRHARSAAERRYLAKMAALLWLAVILFLAGLFLIPKPWNMLLWIPYGPLLAYFIVTVNRNCEKLARQGNGV